MCVNHSVEQAVLPIGSVLPPRGLRKEEPLFAESLSNGLARLCRLQHLGVRQEGCHFQPQTFLVDKSSSTDGLPDTDGCVSHCCVLVCASAMGFSIYVSVFSSSQTPVFFVGGVLDLLRLGDEESLTLLACLAPQSRHRTKTLGVRVGSF